MQSALLFSTSFVHGEIKGISSCHYQGWLHVCGLWTKKNDSFSVAWICGGFLGVQRLCFGVLMDIDEAHNNKEPDTKFHKLCDERFWNTDPQTLSGKYWSQVEHRKMTHTFYNGETWVVIKPEPLDLWNFRISWNSKQTHHSYLDPKETSEEFRFENISA